jgi:putative endonuclease
MALGSWIVDKWRPATLGERGEEMAARFLRRQGFRIVARRNRARYGEIDLIAVEGRTVVFVEVKTRRSERMGSPAVAVDAVRRRRMTRAAIAFLKGHELLGRPSRFDVVEVVWPDEREWPVVRHHQNAFPAYGEGQFYR